MFNTICCPLANVRIARLDPGTIFPEEGAPEVTRRFGPFLVRKKSPPLIRTSAMIAAALHLRRTEGKERRTPRRFDAGKEVGVLSTDRIRCRTGCQAACPARSGLPAGVPLS